MSTGVIKFIFIEILLVIIFIAITLIAQDEKSIHPRLRQGNFLTEEQAREELESFARSYSNLEDWQARAGRIREGIDPLLVD